MKKQPKRRPQFELRHKKSVKSVGSPRPGRAPLPMFSMIVDALREVWRPTGSAGAELGAQGVVCPLFPLVGCPAAITDQQQVELGAEQAEQHVGGVLCRQSLAGPRLGREGLRGGRQDSEARVGALGPEYSHSGVRLPGVV